MRMLFIKMRHIGDALLLTPTLRAAKQRHPNAEIWVALRDSCQHILEGCTAVDRILTTARPEKEARKPSSLLSDLRTCALLRNTSFDYVFELSDNDRGRWLALAANTSRRCTNTYYNLGWYWRPFFHEICQTQRHGLHQVLRDYACPQQVLGLPKDPPALDFETQRMEPWAPATLLSPGNYAVIHIHTRWPRKMWPLQRWESLIESLLTIVPSVVLSCGPGEKEISEARALCAKAGPRVITTAGSTSWAQLAWLLHRARFFVGVDTAAMHLAAAVQCPVVCLFGPSPDFEYYPWRTRYWMLRPQDWLPKETITQLGPDNLMEQIPVDRVLAACHQAAELHNPAAAAT